MPSEHLALFIESKFGPFTLRRNETPRPGAGQLLVKIQASGLNPVDWKIQKLGEFIEDYPIIIGTDIAGIVEEIGEGVVGFDKGDRVLYQGSWTNDKAGYQQYNLTDASNTAKIPAHLTLEEAASIPVAIAVPVAALYNSKPYGAGFVAPFESSTRGHDAGKPFFVFGGSSSVGQYVIQFAKLSGFYPIITTASLKHQEYLKSLGATHVIDRQIPLSSLPDEIAKVTTSPIETVFDAISDADTQQAGYTVVANGGQLITVRDPQVKNPTESKRIIHVLGIFALPHNREIGLKFYARLSALLEEGVIRPNRVELVPGGLNGVAGGLARLESNQVSGTKLVVRPQETVT